LDRTIVKIFKSLADETRLQMLIFLTKVDELCVCDFVEILKISQSKASRHLRYLANAGLVLDRKTAVWVYYRLDPNPGREQSLILETVKKILTAEQECEIVKMLKKRAESKKSQVCETPLKKTTQKKHSIMRKAKSK